jgi:hypothetical protein
MKQLRLLGYPAMAGPPPPASLPPPPRPPPSTVCSQMSVQAPTTLLNAPAWYLNAIGGLSGAAVLPASGWVHMG